MLRTYQKPQATTFVRTDGDVRHGTDGRILVIESSEVAALWNRDIKRHSYDCLGSLFQRTVLQSFDQLQVRVYRVLLFQFQSHGVKMG